MHVRVLAVVLGLAAILLAAGRTGAADTFGTGENQFTIDFVMISGSTNPTSGWGIVNNHYRIGVYEITNAQWDKFNASLGVPVTGDPTVAYDEDSYWTGANVPTNRVSWYEAAQFLNWLNTSSGHQAAYKFTGTQGTSDYTLATWSASEADNGTNLYRHKDAFYYLPTEHEWVKAGYWNGTTLQIYATKAGESLHQGDGVTGTGWNYYSGGYATDACGPWALGSGSEELNGTFDMMGNVREWPESPYSDPNYGAGSNRGERGGSYYWEDYALASSSRPSYSTPGYESPDLGFRVASEIPEPATMAVFALGSIGMLLKRRGVRRGGTLNQTAPRSPGARLSSPKSDD